MTNTTLHEPATKTQKSDQPPQVQDWFRRLNHWLDLSQHEPIVRARRRSRRTIAMVVIFILSLLLAEFAGEPNISWTFTLFGGAGLIFGLWGSWLKSTETDPDRCFRDRTLRAITLAIAVLGLSYVLEPLYNGTVSTTVPDLIASTLAVGLSVFALNAGKINFANAAIFIFPIEFFLFEQLSSGYWDASVSGTLVTLSIVILLISRLRLGIFIDCVIFALYVLVTIINPAHLVNPLSPTNYYKDVPLDLTVTGVMVALVILVTSYVSRELEQRSQKLVDLVDTLEQRVTARTHELELAADVSRQVVSDLNLATLLVNLVELTRAAFDLEVVTLYIFDSETQKLRFSAGTADKSREGGQVDVLVAQAANNLKAMLNNHMPNGPSELALPLLVAGELLAVLHLKAEQTNRFIDADVKALETLTNQLAIAIRNARSFANETVLRQESQLLFQISEAVNSAMTFQALVDSTVPVIQARPYDVTLAFYEHLDQNRATYAETAAIVLAGETRAIVEARREPIFVPFDTSQRLYVIDDIDNPPSQYALMAAFYAARGFKCVLVVYLKLGDQLIGTITFSAATPYHFAPTEIRTVQGIADILVSAAERIRLYNDQVKMTEKLRTLDMLKSQFLASMSHELRTPLNAVLNFTEFVATGMLGVVNEKQRDALNKALESGKHLLSLINDVLDITKIEANMMTLFVEDNLALPVELETVIATSQPLLKDKPVQLVLDIDADLPLIIGDRRRIRQILLNLLSNAAKFTAKGSITLSVKNQRDNVLFAVIDTGPGISAADQGIIFEPFTQSDLGRKSAGGTGLGLPISKRLAEAHGGKLWVESEEGDGSAFYVLLPVRSENMVKLLKTMTAPNLIETTGSC